MGLGVLEDTKLANVPGTSDIYEQNSDANDQTPGISGLKCDCSGKQPIILVPQPSNDPNDPLNWPLWRRDMILAILSFVTILCTTLSSILAANTVTIADYEEITFTAAALLTGYHLCGVGVAGILIVPTARVWGKRHLFLIGHVLMIISCIWAGGVALAPFEALVNACVGDLYFVHERGKRMAVSNVALFGAAFLTPVVVGKITKSMGWQWSFYFVAIFLGASLPLMFFFVPETAFRRSDYLNTDFKRSSGHGESMESHVSLSGASTDDTKELRSGSNDLNGSSKAEAAITVPEKHSFAQSLKLFDGRKTDESFFKLLLRPFPLFFHPGIFWACLIQGVVIGWAVFVGVVLAIVFLGPPMWFEEDKTGYLYTGAFIGSVVGLILSGLLSDSINKLMIRLNHGKYEPEFRILLVIPQLIFCGIGLYGFGWTADNVMHYGWLLPDVFFAFLIVGMVMGAVAASLYVVDAHREIAIEAFTCMLVFKNMFSFVLTFFAYKWFAHGGIKHTMIIIGSIQVGICLLSIPMYVFGKWNRSFFARHDILEMLHLR
ncbi:Major facilitator superfamily domain, general substrate transporter [Penicillium expansum]|uniref:Major facilitator superfamily domain, general substrate transporter n=1 Tax=Penicillium expansum TaxID=27334 RepID=A0A0A2I7M4_PENEN|nr:Major facilitator superfamily domain, general substrate transporter [Penicillium expansum]KGO39067.1 Major facilitator superfamily domain, general substrate transporter [Penicillium expansum]KGO53948.1 Major facilitator superfamily domain, general substrate transporter [Penicillium expansum]